MTEKRNIAQNLAEDEVLQWVTFQLENETYGINVMQVQEVLRYTEIARPVRPSMYWASSTCAATWSPSSIPVPVSACPPAM